MPSPFRRPLWTCTLAAAVATAALCDRAGLSLAPGSGPIILVFALIAAGCIARTRSGSDGRDRLFGTLECVLLFTIVCALGAILSYVALLHSTGLTDGLLDRADRMLGLTWPMIHAAVERRPLLRRGLEAGYFAYTLLPLAMFALLHVGGRVDRMYRFIAAHALALLVTVATFRFFPARAAFAHYLGTGTVLPANAASYTATIDGLRDGSLRTVDLSHLDGIITFPSFHASMAILFAWAAWPVAGRWRLPFTLVNALMWAGAVPIGGHYVVDVIGGSAIAVAAIAVVGRVRHSAPVSADDRRPQPVTSPPPAGWTEPLAADQPG